MAETIGRFLGETSAQKVAEASRCFFRKSVPVRLTLQDADQDVGDGGREERPLTAESFVETAAEGPDVGAPVDCVKVEDMRAQQAYWKDWGKLTQEERTAIIMDTGAIIAPRSPASSTMTTMATTTTMTRRPSSRTTRRSTRLTRCRSTSLSSPTPPGR